MTYNFDFDRWYENQRRVLDARKASGELDEEAMAKLLEELETRYDEMCRRLDRSSSCRSTNRSVAGQCWRAPFSADAIRRLMSSMEPSPLIRLIKPAFS